MKTTTGRPWRSRGGWERVTVGIHMRRRLLPNHGGPVTGLGSIPRPWLIGFGRMYTTCNPVGAIGGGTGTAKALQVKPAKYWRRMGDELGTTQGVMLQEPLAVAYQAAVPMMSRHLALYIRLPHRWRLGPRSGATHQGAKFGCQAAVGSAALPADTDHRKNSVHPKCEVRSYTAGVFSPGLRRPGRRGSGRLRLSSRRPAFSNRPQTKPAPTRRQGERLRGNLAYES
ncbi:hypothetical protein GQ53DRAFT_26111 [Thozetella sp. PMI_491]|nr:hypothetical protein GQ53DRAFT_26111 [Thozetella sp. PMI_491]